ncbi:hypothetical protein CPB84DRAFT_1791811, partial [Gymnopilus junonius]
FICTVYGTPHCTSCTPVLTVTSAGADLSYRWTQIRCARGVFMDVSTPQKIDPPFPGPLQVRTPTFRLPLKGHSKVLDSICAHMQSLFPKSLSRVICTAFQVTRRDPPSIIPRENRTQLRAKNSRSHQDGRKGGRKGKRNKQTNDSFPIHKFKLKNSSLRPTHAPTHAPTQSSQLPASNIIHEPVQNNLDVRNTHSDANSTLVTSTPTQGRIFEFRPWVRPVSPVTPPAPKELQIIHYQFKK